MPEERGWAIARKHIFLPPGQNEFDSGRGELAEDIAEAIREAVEAEREACARIVDSWTSPNLYSEMTVFAATEMAAEIRTQGKEEE